MEKMMDLIERQKAIDVLLKLQRALQLIEEPEPDLAIIETQYMLRKIEQLPSVQPKIISCEECKYRDEKSIADGRYWCKLLNTFMYYCSEGEMRNND